MSNLLKKFIFSFLTFLVVFLSVAPVFTVKAQTPVPVWYNQTFPSWYGKVYEESNPSEIFGERYTAAQVQWVIYGLWSFLINTTTGPENAAAVTCILKTFGASQLDLSCIPKIGGLPTVQPVASKGSILSEIFSGDRPISGIGYVKGKIKNFSLVPVAHAQTVGFGFNALSPIQPLWAIVRNISFGFFVVIAVVFSFMIMFRIKISPQTVITVQSAIPKIIISLVLVTFSYAIAGFMIDLMYVVIGLVAVMGSQFLVSLNIGGVNWTAINAYHLLTLGQPLGLNVNIGILGLMIFYIVMFFAAFIVIFLLNIGFVYAALLTISGIGPVLLIVFAIVVIIVGIIMIIFNSLKTFWALLKAFVNIILLTIFAPIQITLGTFIPNFGFGSWMRSYFAALSTFVVTGALMLFAYIFLAQGIFVAAQGLVNTPGTGPVVGFLSAIVKILFGQVNTMNPLTGNSNDWPPLLGTGGGGWTGLLLLGVSFVLFTLAPKATQVVQGFMSGKPFAYGSAIGEAMGPVNWGAGQAWNNSGARDMWEITKLARKGRFMTENFKAKTPGRGLAEFLVGGQIDKRSKVLEDAMRKYKQQSGFPGKV